jgi:kumamolisin
MARRREQSPVPGSHREPVPGARKVGAAKPDERVEVTVLVRPRSGGGVSLDELAAQPPGKREHLTREQLAELEGADPDDIRRVAAFAKEHGLDVIEQSAAQRSVKLGGTVEAMSRAFGTTLDRYDSPRGEYRGRTGPVHVPKALEPIVEAVLGLDDRPQAAPHFRVHGQNGGVFAAHASGASFTPPQLASLYDFPPKMDGTGQKIAIIELGGGYRTTDLTTYFKSLGIKKPKVTAVSVDGATNAPEGTPDGADGEVMLDIEVAGAMAPGAEILVYFAPNTDRGFLDAVLAAVHDKRARRP